MWGSISVSLRTSAQCRSGVKESQFQWELHLTKDMKILERGIKNPKPWTWHLYQVKATEPRDKMQASAAGEWEISWRAMKFPIKSLLQGNPQLQGCRESRCCGHSGCCCWQPMEHEPTGCFIPVWSSTPQNLRLSRYEKSTGSSCCWVGARTSAGLSLNPFGSRPKVTNMGSCGCIICKPQHF